MSEMSESTFNGQNIPFDTTLLTSLYSGDYGFSNDRILDLIYSSNYVNSMNIINPEQYDKTYELCIYAKFNGFVLSDIASIQGIDQKYVIYFSKLKLKNSLAKMLVFYGWKEPIAYIYKQDDNYLQQTYQEFFLLSISKGYFELTKWFYSLSKIDLTAYQYCAFKISFKSGRMDILKWLLSLTDIDFSMNDNIFFITACKSNKIEMVDFIFGKITINLLNYINLFTFSIRNNYLGVAEYLFLKSQENGLGDLFREILFDPNIFIYVCHKGYQQMINWIYSFKNNIVDTSLFISICSQGYSPLVRWCYANCSISEYLNEGYLAAYQNGYSRVGGYIRRQKEFTIDIKEYNFNSIFIQCCISGHLKIAKRLVSYGYSNSIATKGTLSERKNLFRLVAKAGKVNIIQWLYDIKLLTEEEFLTSNFLESACFSNSLETVQLIYQLNPKLSVTQKNTAFIQAWQKQNITISKFIFSLGDINLFINSNKLFISSVIGGFVQRTKILFSLIDKFSEYLDLWVYLMILAVDKLDRKMVIYLNSFNTTENKINNNQLFQNLTGYNFLTEIIDTFDLSLIDYTNSNINKLFTLSCLNNHLTLAKNIYDNIKYDLSTNNDYLFRQCCYKNRSQNIDVILWIYSISSVDIYFNNNEIFRLAVKNKNSTIVVYFYSLYTIEGYDILDTSYGNTKDRIWVQSLSLTA